ncbi:MAG: hypothetical protein KKB03_01585 [Nanoarchaeota archaeon]|nr:hypothetical protein [Nanoarchaeota archaeon]MBU1135326.1 hypothetical protein [Nanoarchaeota archaeon]MBU2519918.1 hypothetical protein [Nanoarchaeota archaeon]
MNRIFSKWWFWSAVVILLVAATLFLPIWNCHCGIDGCTQIPAHAHNFFEAWGHVH